ncbi:SIMPL domain-containing protein [Paraglaciecola aquimarina]|uniref:SIMPL domain-containing protein n=1 Tax=Paraglaciecola algarum TaxID=3050085 RepID=A0ABS9D2L3_9ALTE|nr:SIMPL domain-containing protein [Paraglaciecola sp. G1-23]MCF2947150.1 SIMPL domain-containing protein [Paraglaciecola sp. G1-23]
MFKIICITLFSTFIVNYSVAATQDNQTRHIKVTGMGVVNSTPDIFSFVVHIEEKGKFAGELNKIIKTKTLDVVNALTSIGVEKKSIQTLQVRFNPWIEYKREGNEQKGFVLTRKIKVTLDKLEQYGQSIDALLNIGITRIDGFSATSSKSAENYQSALQSALLNAQKRASQMVQTLDLKLGKVITISEQSSGNVAPVEMDVLRMSAAKTSSYQPGEVAMQARVEVVFSLVD